MKRRPILSLCLLASIYVFGQTPTPIEYYKPTGASSGYTNALVVPDVPKGIGN